MKLKNNVDPNSTDCHATLCRGVFEVTYQPGATPLNPKRIVRLCDLHQKRWEAELSAHWAAEKAAASQTTEDKEP